MICTNCGINQTVSFIDPKCKYCRGIVTIENKGRGNAPSITKEHEEAMSKKQSQEFTRCTKCRDRHPKKDSVCGLGLDNEPDGTKVQSIDMDTFRFTDDSHVNSVIKELITRSVNGKKKYGVTLDRTDLTLKQRLQHLKEELMDATNYIQKIISML